MKIYDVAFLGMGASGLATLKLNYENNSISIVGIDKKYNSNRNNFFAFWLTDWMEEFSELIKNRWHKWEFHFNERNISHESKKMPYCVMRFQDWKKFCIEGFDNLEIKENDVTSLNKVDDFFEITLDNKEKVYSKRVYDSRTPEEQKNRLKQHFLGYLIRSEELDYHNIVNLMDFRVTQEAGLHFIYVLPLNNKEILIESTVFSKTTLEKEWYENQIDKYINNNLKVQKYKLIGEECGVLPMYSINYKNNDDKHINIGSRGGATKISSGYAFSFFLKKLKSSKHNENKDHHSFLDNLMDKIFVNYIENNIGTDVIFQNMVNSINGEEFASFMMGTAKVTTKFKIISSMPKLGFIQSFFRSYSD